MKLIDLPEQLRAKVMHKIATTGTANVCKSGDTWVLLDDDFVVECFTAGNLVACKFEEQLQNHLTNLEPSEATKGFTMVEKEPKEAVVDLWAPFDRYEIVQIFEVQTQEPLGGRLAVVKPKETI